MGCEVDCEVENSELEMKREAVNTSRRGFKHEVVNTGLRGGRTLILWLWVRVPKGRLHSFDAIIEAQENAKSALRAGYKQVLRHIFG